MNFDPVSLAMYSVQITGRLWAKCNGCGTFHSGNGIFSTSYIAVCVEGDDIALIKDVFVDGCE